MTLQVGLNLVAALQHGFLAGLGKGSELAAFLQEPGRFQLKPASRYEVTVELQNLTGLNDLVAIADDRERGQGVGRVLDFRLLWAPVRTC